MMKGKYRWVPPVLWGLLITFLSLIPGGPGNLNFLGLPYFDKMGHCGMYAIWAFLIFNAFSGNPSISFRKAFWITFILGTLIGISFEYIQDAMRLGRMFEVNDMIANGIGSLSGALIGWWLKKSGTKS
ncbi:MAG: VanZ family protein [Saprospiraceae bacterium]